MCKEEMVPSERIVECVFGEIAEAGELSPVSISRLLALYKLSTLDAALSIVDKGMVQKLVAESGRSLYLVESSGDEPYGATSSFFCAHVRVCVRQTNDDAALLSSLFQALLPLPLLLHERHQPPRSSCLQACKRLYAHSRTLHLPILSRQALACKLVRYFQYSQHFHLRVVIFFR